MFFYFTLRHFYAAQYQQPHILTYQGQLWDFSPELKAYGISLQTPLKMARHHAPQALVAAIDFSQFQQPQSKWLDWSRLWFSQIEPEYPHAWYGRLQTPLSWQPIIEDFQHQLQQSNLEGTWGGGWSKLTAKLAARQNTGAVILPEDTEHFLRDLPIYWLAPAKASALEKLGIYTIGQLASLSLPQLQQQFGADGDHLYYAARGFDRTPFSPLPDEPAPWQFDFSAHPEYHGREDMFYVFHILEEGCQELASAFASKGLAIKSLQFCWQTWDGRRECQQLPLHAPSNKADDLMRRLTAQVPRCILHWVSLAVNDWEEEFPEQLDLFAAPRKDTPSIEAVLQQLQAVLGRSSITTLSIPRREKVLALWEGKPL